MPYKSTKQQAWAHTPAGTKALGGAAKVHEWDQATKRQLGGFKALPTRVPKRAGDPPGASYNMRPSVAPMGIQSMKMLRPVRGAPIKMAKPKGAGKIPSAPAGSRAMSRKPFGSMAPSMPGFTPPEGVDSFGSRL